jgi:LmbE family N-acetylglucosaminyl deacetylase
VFAPLITPIRPRVRRAARDETSLVTRRSALILAPHPDDETVGCGASILRKLAADTAVTVVVVTDGRHSHPNPYIGPDEMRELRAAELAEATSRLRLPMGSVRQLGYADRSITAHEDTLVDVIGDLIAELRPEEIYVTGAFEPHADHAALGRAARRAVARSAVAFGAETPVLYEYPIWLWFSLPSFAPWRSRLATMKRAADVLLLRRRPVKVDSTGYVDTKMHALAAYASQLGRPAAVPESHPWVPLPPSLLAFASDSVELFLPWSPTRASTHAL